MCEPTHSIVQYPDQDPNSGNPTGGILGATFEGVKKKSKLVDWLKRIKDWFHLSVLGNGHSECISATPGAQGLLPEPMFYEGLWWDRTVRPDHPWPYMSAALDQAEALCAAQAYSERVVIGNRSMLKRFLETSIRHSDRPQLYVDKVQTCLIVPKFRDKLQRRLNNAICLTQKNVYRLTNLNYVSGALTKWSSERLEKVLMVVLGFLRRREHLCSAWADDDRLWIPDSGIVTA